MTSVPIINQTNRYILYLLTTDDINYTVNEDLKFMYVCMCVYHYYPIALL